MEPRWAARKLIVMKTAFVFTLLYFVVLVAAVGQEKYVTKTGEITFEASVPSFEEVKAKNEGVSAVFDTKTGNFAALALMKAFRFKVALMEEHFNENYIESSKYPKATFKGVVQDYIGSEDATKTDYVIKGILNLHGVDKNLEVPATVSTTDDKVYLTAAFVLNPEDFNIKIPSIVSNKIAKTVNVSVVFDLQKQ